MYSVIVYPKTAEGASEYLSASGETENVGCFTIPLDEEQVLLDSFDLFYRECDLFLMDGEFTDVLEKDFQKFKNCLRIIKEKTPKTWELIDSLNEYQEFSILFKSEAF